MFLAVLCNRRAPQHAQLRGSGRGSGGKRRGVKVAVEEVEEWEARGKGGRGNRKNWGIGRNGCREYQK